MADEDRWIIHTDGAARDNPGPAAFAFVIKPPHGAVVEDNGCLGTTTNNVAEYTAILKALQKAKELGGRRLHVHSDSELIVKQLQGQYRVKNEGLKPLHSQVTALMRDFENVQYTHVPRAQNKRADQLCNDALDGRRDGKPAAAKAKPAKANPDRAAQVRADAVDCLRAVAAAWARGNPSNPSPEQVWDQLWTILEDGGVLRP